MRWYGLSVEAMTYTEACYRAIIHCTSRSIEAIYKLSNCFFAMEQISGPKSVDSRHHLILMLIFAG